MFLSRNKKTNVYPCKFQFYYIKVGFKGVKIIQVCFRDACIITELKGSFNLTLFSSMIVSYSTQSQSTIIAYKTNQYTCLQLLKPFENIINTDTDSLRKTT